MLLFLSWDVEDEFAGKIFLSVKQSQNWHKPPLVVGTECGDATVMEGEKYVYGYKDKDNYFLRMCTT